MSCSDRNNSADDVREARQKAAEKQEDLIEAQRDVEDARIELAKARGEFIVASNRRLAEIDARIVELRQQKHSKIDWSEVTRLRESADRLRTEVGNNVRVFAQSVKTEFEQLVTEIDARLSD